MKSEPIISVSGLRGIVGESLTPQVASQYVAAFIDELPPGPLVVSYDGRTTGPMLMSLICGAAMAAGRDVIDAGIAATPTTGVLVRDQQAAGGVQISASHNPPEYNGIKLFSAEGRVVPAALGERVLNRYRQGEPFWQRHEKIGARCHLASSTAAHLALVVAAVDVAAIRAAKFKVLLDSNHGSGSILGRALLEHLGCEVVVMGETPDGRFEHTPEPTAENLATVLPAVTKHKAHVGFCQDPDADRLAVIDERGNYLGEEYTLAMCCDHVLRQRPGPIVINCSTSRMAVDVAAKYNVPCYLSAVGEANVVDLMLAKKAVLGGEGNGGVIDPRIGLVRDSFIGMALLLEAMAVRQLPVSALASELPSYAICKTKITLAADRLQSGYQAIERLYPEAKVSRQDGLRLDWPDRWFLVRPSNTEPIVRAFAEAPTMAVAQGICHAASEALAKV